MLKLHSQAAYYLANSRAHSFCVKGRSSSVVSVMVFDKALHGTQVGSEQRIRIIRTVRVRYVVLRGSVDHPLTSR